MGGRPCVFLVLAVGVVAVLSLVRRSPGRRAPAAAVAVGGLLGSGAATPDEADVRGDAARALLGRLTDALEHGSRLRRACAGRAEGPRRGARARDVARQRPVPGRRRTCRCATSTRTAARSTDDQRAPSATAPGSADVRARVAGRAGSTRPRARARSRSRFVETRRGAAFVIRPGRRRRGGALWLLDRLERRVAPDGPWWRWPGHRRYRSLLRAWPTRPSPTSARSSPAGADGSSSRSRETSRSSDGCWARSRRVRRDRRCHHDGRRVDVRRRAGAHLREPDGLRPSRPAWRADRDEPRGHARRHRGGASRAMPTWLLEGFADYVALDHVDLPVSVAASQILAQVRDGRPAGAPPRRRTEFDPQNQALGASYESAWLACRLLGETYGEAAADRVLPGRRPGRLDGAAFRAAAGHRRAGVHRARGGTTCAGSPAERGRLGGVTAADEPQRARRPRCGRRWRRCVPSSVSRRWLVPWDPVPGGTPAPGCGPRRCSPPSRSRRAEDYTSLRRGC